MAVLREELADCIPREWSAQQEQKASPLLPGQKTNELIAWAKKRKNEKREEGSKV